MHAVVGVLDDGTPYFAPVGTVDRDGSRVRCHLCGGWYRSVLPHLRKHGWDQLTYRAAFGLERGQSLEGDATRGRRAGALRVRRERDPAVRAGSAAGIGLARSGELTRAAARAARGRRQPEQRRRKTLASLAAISPEARDAGTRRFRHAQLGTVSRDAAARLGFDSIGALVRDRVAAGASLAAISREAGLHKDWLCRHLATVDPDAAREVQESGRRARLDAPWLPVLAGLGFPCVATYLVDRHVVRRCTVSTIAVEVGMCRASVQGALARHGITQVAHARTRGATEDRAAEVAARFGHTDLTEYLDARRAAGLSWRAIAAECGRPATWVRRRAGLPD
ncbi:hypothetical protein [Pseudonocardia abyssalis]|nr:hypothetical protein [Pseudonocardia abyssalis]MBW0114819.1 hypothetical protein [Pseudonocardia abyssalis]